MTTLLINSHVKIYGFKITKRNKRESIKDHIKRHDSQ